MSEYENFQRKVLVGLKASLVSAEGLVELYTEMLKSKMLSTDERKTTERGLKQNEEAVRMYKGLIEKSGENRA
jgi:hypothetical protein